MKYFCLGHYTNSFTGSDQYPVGQARQWWRQFGDVTPDSTLWLALIMSSRNVLNEIVCYALNLIFMASVLGRVLPKQRSSQDLMFTFTHYLYYVLIAHNLLFIKTCFQLQNRINHTRRRHQWQKMSGGALYLLSWKMFRIRYAPSHREFICLTQLEISHYCFSNILPHLPF